MAGGKLNQPRTRGAHGRQIGRRRGGSAPGGSDGCRSLEDVVIGAISDLRTAGVAGCPACGRRSLHADGCLDCGSALD
jgi:hypothetical protein